MLQHSSLKFYYFLKSSLISLLVIYAGVHQVRNPYYFFNFVVSLHSFFSFFLFYPALYLKNKYFSSSVSVFETCLLNPFFIWQPNRNLVALDLQACISLTGVPVFIFLHGEVKRLCLWRSETAITNEKTYNSCNKSSLLLANAQYRRRHVTCVI